MLSILPQLELNIFLICLCVVFWVIPIIKKNICNIYRNKLIYIQPEIDYQKLRKFSHLNITFEYKNILQYKI